MKGELTMEATLIRDERNALLPGSTFASSRGVEVVCTIATQGAWNDTDQTGHIAGFSDWTPDEALMLAGADGINLGEQHWRVIHFMRGYYMQHRSCPLLKLILKKVNQMPGGQTLDVRGMVKLFGTTPVRTAARFAGLPDPDSCI